MKKAIVFDLDGTLTDSGEGIMNCALLALEHFGLPLPTREELRVIVGPPLDQSFIRFGVPADRTGEAIAVYRSRYTTVGKFENHPYPGIKEVLERLQEAGHRLFVATSKPEDMSVEILEKFELAPYFERICGATLDGTRSHKADVIAYLLSQVRDAENIVMVGDTKFDVLGAKAHHIPTIAVAWGYGSREEMLEAGAVAIAETPADLLRLV